MKFGKFVELHPAIWGVLPSRRMASCRRLSARRLLVHFDLSRPPEPPGFEDQPPHPAPLSCRAVKLGNVAGNLERIVDRDEDSALLLVNLESSLSNRWSVQCSDEFKLATRKVLRCGGIVVTNAVLEGRHAWIFPQGFSFTSSGIIVDKRTRVVSEAGARWEPDAWLWAYDRGLRRETSGVLVVDAIFDLSGARRILSKCGLDPSSLSTAGSAQPEAAVGVVDWRAIGPLWEDQERSFTWHFEADGRPDPSGEPAMGDAKVCHPEASFLAESR
jgi:hypothetical protein